VEYVLRIQWEAPELFEKLHVGTLTIQAALKTLNGDMDDAQRRATKAAWSEFNRAPRDLGRHPDYLSRFRAFLTEFAE